MGRDRLFDHYKRLQRFGKEDSVPIMKIKYAANRIAQALVDAVPGSSSCRQYQVKDKKLLAAYADISLNDPRITRQAALQFSVDIASGLLQEWRANLEAQEINPDSEIWDFKPHIEESGEED